MLCLLYRINCIQCQVCTGATQELSWWGEGRPEIEFQARVSRQEIRKAWKSKMNLNFIDTKHLQSGDLMWKRKRVRGQCLSRFQPQGSYRRVYSTEKLHKLAANSTLRILQSNSWKLTIHCYTLQLIIYCRENALFASPCT